MKHNSIIKYAILAVLTMGAACACAEKEFQEVTALSLSRCLEPQDLSARVNNATGVDVSFSWDVNKDADQYNLVVYTDEAMTAQALDKIIGADEVPYIVSLPADTKYWFKVQALSDKREPSLWAVYDGSVKTFAVKDNLFPTVTARTDGSVSLEWSKDAADYTELTHVTCTPVKGGKEVTYNLTDADKTAAKVTVSGLEPSTEYQVTIFYLSASRGSLDVWTLGAKGAAVTVSTEADLIAALTAGGEIYLLGSGSPYSVGTVKPAGSVKIIGEMAGDGSKPEVTGKIELTDAFPAGGSLYAEGVKFNGGGANSRIVEHTGGALNVTNIEFKNCEITNYLAGLFYGNNANVIHIGTVKFDSCDIYAILGSGGDAFDLRQTTEIDNIVFYGNTIYDGIRTMFRIDAKDDIKIGTLDFQNNTVKAIAVMDDGNNRGFFAPRVAMNLTLKKNLFLYEDGGKTGADDVDKAQLIQDNAGTVVPTLDASGNYAYACGKDFFKKVSAAEAGFTVLEADPCYNSKGNFFQLSNDDLISKQVGAPKWWISYVEKEEDLTQNALTGAHTWNLQDATLFAGDVKNKRVRDELMFTASEAVAMNADGGINFLSASPLNRKGVPTDGFLSFKVTKAGSVDLQVSDKQARGNSVVVALSDDNGFAVKGGAVASAAKGGVEKIVVSPVNGEGTVYLYATGPITLDKLAWSEDTSAGSKVLPAPKPVVEPVTLTEGDETAVTVTWEAVPNAASYVVIFNKRAMDPQTECSYTVASEDIAALKAGLYNFSVQAFPREDDLYYVKSEAGAASFAIQPKGGGGEIVNVEKVWDFSQADWQEQFAAYGKSGADITDWNLTYDDLTFWSKTKSKYNTSYMQFGGAGINKDTGEYDRCFRFTAPEQGTLKITVSNTGSSEALDRTVRVIVGDEYEDKPGGYPSTSPQTIEFSIKAGEVIITAPVNGLRFYKIEYNYSYTSGGSTPIEYDWDFSTADWQAQFATYGNSGADITGWNLTYDGLTFWSKTKSKYNTSYMQFGGAGINKDTGEYDRCFRFTAPEQGTLKITVSNTGSSEALDRTVRVIVGDDQEDKPGGFPSTGPQEIEFSIKAGDVIITAPVNGLRFYKIYYTNQ